MPDAVDVRDDFVEKEVRVEGDNMLLFGKNLCNRTRKIQAEAQCVADQQRLEKKAQGHAAAMMNQPILEEVGPYYV